jgi:hypothetical protein
MTRTDPVPPPPFEELPVTAKAATTTFDEALGAAYRRGWDDCKAHAEYEAAHGESDD